MGAETMRERPDVEYLPMRCSLLNREVWAIVLKQPDGSRRIVNCLDKDRGCFDHPCVFTTDGGEWPFQQSVIRS